MRIVSAYLIETPLSVVDPKDELIFEAKENHMEITLEDNSVIVIKDSDMYYKIIGDANVANGTEEIYLDKLINNKKSKIYLANYIMENGSIVSYVVVTEYNGQPVYVLQHK